MNLSFTATSAFMRCVEREKRDKRKFAFNMKCLKLFKFNTPNYDKDILHCGTLKWQKSSDKFL